MKVVALAGGTGSAKLLRGLSALESNLTVVANVGDNVWVHGLYVCPDIDTAMYTLAGLSNRLRGWGIEGDTFGVLKQLGALGAETWFALGDRDLATHLIRTQALAKGKTLTQVTEELCKRLKIGQRLLPVTDSRLETKIVTAEGEMDLQEFWVKKGGRPRVTGVRYEGSREAAITPQVADAIRKADKVIICPANPISSIGSMLAVGGLRDSLVGTSAKVAALSPMLGRGPFSGPAAKLMKAAGNSADSVGVAALYVDFLDSRRDRDMMARIERLGIRCHLSDARMESGTAERRLAGELIEA